MFGIVFDKDRDINNTSFRGYLPSPYSFQETVGRLYTMAGDDMFRDCDDKCSFHITGMLENTVFTLYDYKEDDLIHIGGHENLRIDQLIIYLNMMLKVTEPTPYVAQYHYETNRTYHWKPSDEADKNYYLVFRGKDIFLVLARNKKSAMKFVAKKHDCMVAQLEVTKIKLYKA